MATMKIPVFLGSDSFGFPNDVQIGVADVKDNEIVLTIEADKLTSQLDKLVELGQIRGLALSLAYMAPAVKKENDNGST